MPRRLSNKATRAKSTQRIIDELFAHPPISRAEMEQRLAPASVLETRRALIDRLERGAVEEIDGDLLISMFHVVGLGTEAPALLSIVADAQAPRHIRAYALTVLLHADPLHSDKLRQILSEDDLLSLAAHPMCQFLCRIEGNPDDAEALATMLESAPETLRKSLFGHLERFRQESGVPAAVAYEEILRRPPLGELHAAILTALIHEGGLDAVALIEALRSDAADVRVKRNLQGALLRLRTRALEGRSQPLGKTRAYVSSCDGQSAYFLLGERENPDATRTLALLCIRASGDIRDGYVATHQTEPKAREIRTDFMRDAGTEFVEVSLAQALPLITQAIECTLAEGRTLPDSARPSLRFFERVEPLSLPTIVPAAEASATALRARLRQPPYARSWFIDPSDLEASGIKPPASEQPTSAWISRAMRRLSRNATLIHRVEFMARHMAIWHQLRNDAQEAGLLLRAAEEVNAAPAQSQLLRVLLERLFAPATDLALEPPEKAEEPLGEPSRRQFLKSRFFLTVAAPKGRDLALLDFTEAALLALDRALETVPGDVRPREDAVHEAAHELALLFRDYVLLNRKTSTAVLTKRMAAKLAQAGRLQAADCQRLALMVLAALVSFVDEVCSDCAVYCLGRQKAAVAAEFFSPMHPALPHAEPVAPQP